MDDKENNIVQFPYIHKDHAPQTIEDMVDNVSEIRREHAEYIVGDLMPMIISRMVYDGYDFTDDEKMLNFLVETIRASLFKAVGMHHPIHDIIDSLDMDMVSDGFRIVLDIADIEMDPNGGPDEEDDDNTRL